MSKSSDLISIVLPTYNGEKYLRESLDSILAQSYTNWELIIVNDASSDSTLEIAKEYANKDKRISVISNQSNQKLPKSLNIGFANAKGAYLTWSSDDNLYKPKALEKMLNALKSNPDSSMAHCDMDLIDEDGKVMHEIIVDCSPRTLLEVNNTIGSCFLYTKAIADKIGGYDDKQFLVEDYDYWLRIALNGKIITLHENLYAHRSHKDSLTTTKFHKVQKKVIELKKRYFELFLPKFPNLKDAYDTFQAKCRIDSLVDSLMILPKDKVIEAYKEINATLSKKQALRLYKDRFKKTYQTVYLDAMSALGIFYKLKALDYRIKLKFKLRKNEKAYAQSQAYIAKALQAKQWIFDNTLNGEGGGKGIIISSDQRVIYPEVSGYYIPTLIKWGERELAKSYAEYLLTIQNEDGSWNEPYGKYKYTFDTGQILKGLWELMNCGFVDEAQKQKYEKAFLKGCDYILAQQRQDGSIATDNYDYWGLAYGKVVPESIHLYCLEPLRNAAKKFNAPKYEECVKKALDFYLADKALTDFTTLSHFNAYIIEALIDLGHTKEAQEAMDKIATLQRKDGFIQAYPDSDKFTCSTGLFQYAICWAKLGGEENLKRAERSFYHALDLQNASGGWYGSYGKGSNYFPQGEISWAVKYFFDALYFIPLGKLENFVQFRMAHIDEDDGRFLLFREQIKSASKILDVGVAKGRYERNLAPSEYEGKEFFGIDISPSVLDFTPEFMQTKQGTLLNIPFPDESFDLVFCSEAFGFAIDVGRAVEELYRVTKRGGAILVIDKREDFVRRFRVVYFEQYFEQYLFKNALEKTGLQVQLIDNVPYEDTNDGLFVAWVARKP